MDESITHFVDVWPSLLSVQVRLEFIIETLVCYIVGLLVCGPEMKK